MSDVIIRAENLGKRYLLSHQPNGAGYTRFSESLVHWAKAPLRWMQQGARSKEQAPTSSLRPPISPLRSSISETEEFWALKDVSFEIKRGEVVGIIGRNGAGKSTLLKLISRITEPTTGCIALQGRTASLLEVGTGFHPELTGRENIYLNGAIMGMRRAEIQGRFDQIVDFAEIGPMLDTPVKRYSSGMYVRLAFAVAAHLEPDILIVDEVLAVGDARFQKRCLGRIESAVSEGRTVLLVSHQMDAIKRFATSGMLLEAGRIAMMGTPSEVVQEYLASANLLETRQAGEGKPHLSSVAMDAKQLSQGRLQVTIRYFSPRPIQQPTVGLVVHSASGAPLFGSNTLMHPAKQQPTGKQEGVVIFTLPDVPLLTGEYTLSLWLNDGIVTLQHLPHALAFTFQDPSPPEHPVDTAIIGCCKMFPTWTFV